ncbi:hypothetical protein HPB47_018210 [Ixodes persulcatus]|uniref:Uncharacterized protein n=1 Tax=Ixodes persulcatus TaxID=34615 RepID=A0AC60QLI9_IXOPE|nr:hypothetical protein HPB47_018210 [Ixodes persulcatus]
MGCMGGNVPESGCQARLRHCSLGMEPPASWATPFGEARNDALRMRSGKPGWVNGSAALRQGGHWNVHRAFRWVRRHIGWSWGTHVHLWKDFRNGDGGSGMGSALKGKKMVEQYPTTASIPRLLGTANDAAAVARRGAALESVRASKDSRVAVGAVAGKAGPGGAGIKPPQLGHAGSGAIPKTRLGVRRPESAVRAGTGGVPGVGPDLSGSFLVPSVSPSRGSGDLIPQETTGGHRMTRSMARAQRAEGSAGAGTSRISTAVKAKVSRKPVETCDPSCLGEGVGTTLRPCASLPTAWEADVHREPIGRPTPSTDSLGGRACRRLGQLGSPIQGVDPSPVYGEASESEGRGLAVPGPCSSEHEPDLLLISSARPERGSSLADSFALKSTQDIEGMFSDGDASGLGVSDRGVILDGTSGSSATAGDPSFYLSSGDVENSSGRLAERPQEGHKSYLEAASTTASGAVRIRETGLGAANDARVDVEGAQTSALVQKPALLIYPTKPKTNSEYSQVMEALRVAISPEELGLSDLETRKVKGGALVASSSSEGIVRLEREINTKRTLREKLQAKKPFRRNPQILVKGISSTIEDLELKAAVINQNHLNGTSEDLKVVRTFPNRDGTKTVVFEVEPELFRQIKTKRRLIVGWTSCSVEENLHVLFCRRCSRYGHTMTRCQECPRCIHCGKDHSGADCDGRSRRTCLACEENPQVHPTDTEHSSSDVDCPTYKWQSCQLNGRPVLVGLLHGMRSEAIAPTPWMQPTSLRSSMAHLLLPPRKTWETQLWVTLDPARRSRLRLGPVVERGTYRGVLTTRTVEKLSL